MELDGSLTINQHFRWSNKNRPVMDVNEGELFSIRIPDSSTGQILRSFSLEDLNKIDSSKYDAGIGPIRIKGAEPGDTIEVNIIDIKTWNWGWTAIMNNFGLLKNEYQEKLVIWKIENGFAKPERGFSRSVEVKIEPFLGVIGTAPENGEFGMIPPQTFGGNMDNKLNRKDSRIFLPVNVEGGLLSFSDPHAAQGDGEVCGTAIETGAEVTAMVKVHKTLKIRSPMTVGSEKCTANYIATTGIDPDLVEASKKAVRNMVEYLKSLGFNEEEGYILSSVAGNLRISEIVDEPNFVVSMLMDNDIFKNL